MPDASRTDHYIPAGSAAPPFAVDITPESAGWSESSLRVVALDTDTTLELRTERDEVMILPLAGGGSIECGSEVFELSTRASVFKGPADMVYLGVGQTYRLHGTGRFAICGARTTVSLPNRRIAAADVPIELRGAGHCSRQVHNFGAADTFEAASLIAVEVITPAGNWSSYPAHKHDEQSDVESELEEIYYFEIADGNSGPGIGFHRVYGTVERPIDVLAEVHTGDVVLVPHGYHGPSMAAPGFDMYYLNVMAGPERTWRVTFDPTQAWVRDTWADQSIDPRLPLHHPTTIATARGA